jgi:hypothetical protein
MQRLSLGVAALTAVVFILASATINSLFLSSLGRSALESGLFAAISIASDVAKAILPVIMARAIASRAWFHAAVSGVFLAVTIALSLASGVGFASTTRGSVTAERDGQAQHLARAEADLAGLDRRMASIGPRSIAVIEEDIKALLIDRRWTASDQCATPSGPSERNFCASVFRARAELAAAKEAVELDARRQALRSEIEGLRAQGAGEGSDPQADAVAQMLGIAPRTVRAGLMIVIAVVLELGSVSLVLLIAGPAARPAETRKPPEPVKIEPAPEVIKPVKPVTPASVPVIADRGHWLKQRQKTKA